MDGINEGGQAGRQGQASDLWETDKHIVQVPTKCTQQVECVELKASRVKSHCSHPCLWCRLFVASPALDTSIVSLS